MGDQSGELEVGSPELAIRHLQDFSTQSYLV